MFEPLHDNVILVKEEVENKTSSGIILSGSPKETPSIATVVACGKGKFVDGKLVPLQVKEGDKVVYKEYAATSITYEDKDYSIVAEESILAILK
ncbi:chaperonin GroES [Breznakia sp. PF5-3]|uniref:co-chaperone GroES n=1 Tax=unclassified Breznakia TaxID=2623764 RepID=UPI002405AEF8|nr:MULTISPECIES: co-chaperone GroES [unclassified Breznakia]MDL2276251.1 co-chaperone GroES [Breznakia sp. OttesenSCG-928-G09]MDF9824909.1 chaperonin GroES [Breznakia sp. PM6-1]MDF9835592.1 chaperonin GroES [Breznakia sp. PF5-3]MDF9837992.1 chaperonin GroES [Breznakia sp. PFB2-8]MDF9859981.1 chaperonin GroES [Breznakia sp. PH5-24]